MVVVVVVAVMEVVIVLLVVELVLVLSINLMVIPRAVFHELYSCGLLTDFFTALTKSVCLCLSVFLSLYCLSVCLSVHESVRVSIC